MKAKQILENWNALQGNVKLIRRVLTCEAAILKDILVLCTSGQINNRSIIVSDPHGSHEDRVQLSVAELTLRGMSNLQALLFIDSLAKAQLKGDLAAVAALLGVLPHGRPMSSISITPEMKEQVRVNNPGVWAEYQKLCQRKESENSYVEETISDENKQILESEISGYECTNI